MIVLYTTEREYPYGTLRSTNASKVKVILEEKGYRTASNAYGQGIYGRNHRKCWPNIRSEKSPTSTTMASLSMTLRSSTNISKNDILTHHCFPRSHLLGHVHDVGEFRR